MSAAEFEMGESVFLRHSQPRIKEEEDGIHMIRLLVALADLTVTNGILS